MSTPELLESFFKSHIMPYVNYSSTVWDGCSEIHLSKLKTHFTAAQLAKLLNPDKNLTTDEKQKALSILP